MRFAPHVARLACTCTSAARRVVWQRTDRVVMYTLLSLVKGVIGGIFFYERRELGLAELDGAKRTEFLHAVSLGLSSSQLGEERWLLHKSRVAQGLEKVKRIPTHAVQQRCLSCTHSLEGVAWAPTARDRQCRSEI